MKRNDLSGDFYDATNDIKNKKLERVEIRIYLLNHNYDSACLISFAVTL